MAIYTVHEPPQRWVNATPPTIAADRIVFVRDGFSLWAFLLAPVWMLWHRAWLVLLGYVVLTVGLDVALRLAGASAFVVALVGILIALLVGLEAGTLRRFALRRRGWSNVGIVSGHDIEDAERRFFDNWARQTNAHAGAAPPPLPPLSPAHAVPVAPPLHQPGAPGVIGLFPEPGVNR